MLATIALRLTPLERDFLAASLAALSYRFWPRDSDDEVDDRPRSSRRCRFHFKRRVDDAGRSCERDVVRSAE